MAGEMKASLEALVNASAGWGGVSDEFHSAYMDIVFLQNAGDNFGWFADRAGIPAAHDTFIASMVEALSAGRKEMNQMAEALLTTAKDFGATDLDVADTFHDKDGTPA